MNLNYPRVILIDDLFQEFCMQAEEDSTLIEFLRFEERHEKRDE